MRRPIRGIRRQQNGSPFSPASFSSLTAWWRGTYSDPWTPEVGGDELTHPNAPSAATNGLREIYPANFVAASSNLTATDALTIGDVFSASAGTVVAVFKADALPAPGAVGYEDGSLFRNNTTYISLGVSSAGVRAALYDGAWKVTSGAAITRGVWYMAALVWDSSTLEVSVDAGTPQSVAAGALDPSSYASIIQVGSPYGAYPYFDGKYMELMTFNEALSQADLAAIKTRYVNSRYGLPNAIDPSTMNLTGWYKGSYGGAPWAGSASAGSSGSKSLVTVGADPAVGTSLNGFAAADFASSKKLRDSTYDFEQYLGTGSFRISALVKTPASIPAAAGNIYDNPCIISEAGGNVGLGLHSGAFFCFLYDTTGTAYRVTTSASAPSTSTWYALDVVYDGSSLTISVNGVAGTPDTVTTPGAINALPTVGANYTGTVYFNGEVEALMTAQSDLASVTAEDFVDYYGATYDITL